MCTIRSTAMDEKFPQALWPRSPQARHDVLGLGEISLDHVGVFAGSGPLSGKHELLSLRRHAGGTIATALLGCQRLGLRTSLIGSVGTDPEAKEALGPLEGAGVDLSGVVWVAPGKTRTAFIGVEQQSGSRTVYAHRPPELDLPVSRLDAARVRDSRLLLVDASDPDAGLWAAQIARAEQIPVVLDADSPWPDATSLLDRVDFPVVTEDLACHLSGSANPIDGLRRLVKRGARLAVATCGEAGCVAVEADGVRKLPAFESPVIDSTGAGDAFRAGFIWSLLAGAETHEVLRCASALGALNCGAAGAQEALASKPQLEAFLARQK